MSLKMAGAFPESESDDDDDNNGNGRTTSNSSAYGSQQDRDEARRIGAPKGDDDGLSQLDGLDGITEDDHDAKFDWRRQSMGVD